jgi:hypothetical protein
MGSEAPYVSNESSKKICKRNCELDLTLTAIGRIRCKLSCNVWGSN